LILKLEGRPEGRPLRLILKRTLRIRGGVDFVFWA
jgi:hypothetical protein